MWNIFVYFRVSVAKHRKQNEILSNRMYRRHQFEFYDSYHTLFNVGNSISSIGENYKRNASNLDVMRTLSRESWAKDEIFSKVEFALDSSHELVEINLFHFSSQPQ